MRLGFRLAEGASERVLYRELFLCGLTMLDDIGLLASGERPGHSPTGGRDEVRKLVESLKLPLDERGRRRAAARAEWARSNAAPIEVDDLIAD
jgi:chromosome partitioning protein